MSGKEEQRAHRCPDLIKLGIFWFVLCTLHNGSMCQQDTYAIEDILGAFLFVAVKLILG